MEINATVKLRYDEGLSVVTGSERLYMIIKFKEGKQFFKTVINKTLVSVNMINERSDSNSYYKSKDEYYEEVEGFIKDKKKIESVAIRLIKEHFHKELKDEKSKSRVRNIVNTVNNIKINVKVNID